MNHNFEPKVNEAICRTLFAITDKHEKEIASIGKLIHEATAVCSFACEIPLNTNPDVLKLYRYNGFNVVRSDTIKAALYLIWEPEILKAIS